MLYDAIELNRFAFKCLVDAVCEYCEITPEALLGKNRTREFVKPRHILFYMAYIYTGYSLPQIARKCDRDHTTVLYAYRKITEQRLKSEDLNLAISEIHLIATTKEKERLEEVVRQRNEIEQEIERMGGKSELRSA
jgi:chromosomal replication initiation ATPase DnaA